MREINDSRKASLVQAKLPDELLAPSLLRNTVVEETALAHIEGFVVNKGVDKEQLLRDLTEPPELLVYVLSGTHDRFDWIRCYRFH